ncbi:ankyrin [Nemania sp. FL0916]|nr:ankyrin [Nemania sp. FL0916]
MHLFQLPPELVYLVFEQIVRSREVRRALRIRTVSRQFKTYIDDSIFRIRLLRQHLISGRRIFRNSKASREYVRSYIAYQISRTTSTTSKLGRIRGAAEALCGEDGNPGYETVAACINALTFLAASNDRDSLILAPNAREEDDCSDEDLEADLSVAAVYLGKQSYVRNLVAQNSQFHCIRSTIFGQAFFAATLKGNVEMIKLLLSCSSQYRDEGILPVRQQNQIIRWASFYGHQEAFDFALDARPITLPEKQSDRRGDPHASVLESSIHRIRSLQNYQRLATILGPNSRVFKNHSCFTSPCGWLQRHASLGAAEMVRYFLAMGADPNHARCKPLLSAIKSDDEEIVRLLLEAGADPNMPPPPRSPLIYAVWIGNISIIRLLLEGITNVNEGDPPPIVLAIFKERLDIFRLLRDNGARLDTPETGGWAMAVAQSHGLSSMIDVLVSESVGLDTVLHTVECEQWLRLSFSLWPEG